MKSHKIKKLTNYQYYNLGMCDNSPQADIFKNTYHTTSKKKYIFV